MKKRKVVLAIVFSLLLTGLSVFKIDNVSADESYGTNTIVKDDTKGVWRRIKEGDFFVEVSEAIVNDDDEIVGWVSGTILETNVGKPYNDPILGRVQEKSLELGYPYSPILPNTDGSGSWKLTNVKVGDNVTLRIKESKFHQEREIIDDGLEGELLYIQDDGTKSTVKTDKPSLVIKELPGVDYDDTTYYVELELVGEGVKVISVRAVSPNDNDPLKSMEVLSQERVAEVSFGAMPVRENPYDKLISYFEDKGVTGISTSIAKTIGSEYSTNRPLSFNNNYDLPKGEVEGKAIKRLLEGNNDWELEAGQFSFELKDDKGVVLKTITNNKDGSINFTIPVDHEGIFNYTLSEVKGDNEIIFYDDLTYEIEVKVRFDRLTNKLVSELTYKYEGGRPLSPGVPPYFVNSFELPESEVIGKAKKKLVEDGKEISLKAGQFTFVLKDNQNTIIETVTNDVNGDIEFTIPIEREGVFKYTLEETKGNASDITYDPNIYGIEVTAKFDLGINDYITTLVYTDLEGNPLAQGVIPIFENTQTPPEKPVEPPVNPEEPPVTPEKPDLPNTGIGNTILYIAIIFLLTGTALVLSRKNRFDN